MFISLRFHLKTILNWFNAPKFFVIYIFPGNTPAHLAAQEGHLPCLKFLISNAPSFDHVLSARNDHGETPKDLAHRFYKSAVVEFIDNLEYEKEHDQDEESELFLLRIFNFLMIFKI